MIQWYRVSIVLGHVPAEARPMLSLRREVDLAFESDADRHAGDVESWAACMADDEVRQKLRAGVAAYATSCRRTQCRTAARNETT